MIFSGEQIKTLCPINGEKINTKEIIIEKGCISLFSKIIEKYGYSGEIVAIYDDNTFNAVGKIEGVTREIILSPENLHANEHGIERITASLPKDINVLVAVGGGTIHDLTRYSAKRLDVPFISVPTCASVDGFCSSVAAMTLYGCKKTLTCVAPDVILADVDVIKNAPIRLAKSGMGDLIGKYISTVDWKIGALLLGEPFNEGIAQMSYEAIDVIEKYGKGVIEGDDEAYEKLIYALILSGIAMQLMGNSRPASGAEHHIAHVMEMAKAGSGIHSDALHGERVGVASFLVCQSYQKVFDFGYIKQKPVRDGLDLTQYFDDNVIEELKNEHSDDCLIGVTEEVLNANHAKIEEIIRTIPSVDEFKRTYDELGLMRSLSDIGIEDEKIFELAALSTLVRNRLTLVKLVIK